MIRCGRRCRILRAPVQSTHCLPMYVKLSGGLTRGMDWMVANEF